MGYNDKKEREEFFAMKYSVFLIVVFAILLLAGCRENQQQEPAYRQVGMEKAIAMMEEETDYIILDVRRPDEFAAGHIPNAINIANEEIGTEEIPELPEQDQLILVYCRSGNRSKQASEKLAALGYTNIVEFGGINSWPNEIVVD
jgi:rhodanese-related sulfurtransferase